MHMKVLLITKSKLCMNMEKRVFHVVLLALLMKHVSGIKSGFTLSRNKVGILPGDADCISNCSHISTKGNEPLICSVEECRSLEESGSNSQASELEEDKIYFQTYFDEIEKKQKLALYFKWSPVDNVSMEKTKGYLLNISDGTSHYSACYSISTKMDFHKNAHDLFYNDCFGKVKGTVVVPGSRITVNVTTLPLWKGDHDDGKVMFVVEVPDCDNEKLEDFLECAPPGGKPTNRSCQQTNCSSYSEVNGVVHPVSCSISKSTLHNIAGKEKCEEVDKPVEGSPSQPKHEKKDQEWYKFYDKDGNVKIALNFSWTPRPDSSLEHLHGYYVEITPTSNADFTYYNKCFSVHTNLSGSEHFKAEFFHDCYGRIHDKVTPGSEFLIHLNSLPTKGREMESFEIAIPDCDDERMQDVKVCVDEKQRKMEGIVEDVFCQNRSIKYTYHISPQYGDLADILFCALGKGNKVCKEFVKDMRNVSPKNTLYNISLPSSADLSVKYVLILHASKHGQERLSTEVDFSKCVAKPNGVDETTMMIILILIFGLLCLVGVVVLVCFMFRRNCWRRFTKCWKDERLGRPMDPRPVPIDPSGVGTVSARPEPIQPSLIPSGIRVYVIFMDDHEYHKDVVFHFCAYLKEDLGLDVRLNIWQEKEVAANPIMFMDVNLKKASKVIVICSEGTKNCLNKNEYDGDMFTPVVRNICQQAFVGQNPGKFLVGFFEYSNQSHVPELLNEQCMMYFSLFKLMKQFEQFYFRLVGIEQYQDGGIQRIEKIAFDRYHDPELTWHGKALKEAIDRMKYFVEENPTWYNDLHGSDQPQSNMIPLPPPRPPDGSIVQDRSILDPVPAEASISRLNAAPPPKLRDERFTTEPKVLYTSRRFHEMQPRKIANGSHSSQDTGKYQSVPSAASVSTESSYIVTETEGLSTSLSLANSSPDNQDDKHSRLDAGHCSDRDVFNSYHPESFQEHDFLTFDDNSADSKLLSTKTEITTLGLSPSMENIIGANEIMHPILFQHGEPDEDDELPLPLPSIQEGSKSGFQIANLDDDDGDIEEQIRGINECL